MEDNVKSGARLGHIQPLRGSIGESALDKQVGGNHYKKYNIQPVEFIMENNIGYMEGNVIKYVVRHKDKGGIADLEKAMHYLQMLIEHERNIETKSITGEAR